MAPTRLAFVGGMGRSGTTLIARLLGQLPGAVAVGEIRQLWDLGVQQDWRCACGARFSGCDFWQAVGVEAFGGWSEGLAARALLLRARLDRMRHAATLVLKDPPARLAHDLHSYREILRALYGAIARVSGSPLVVDSSKHPGGIFILLRDPALQLVVVHVVRRLEGVVYSQSKGIQGVTDSYPSLPGEATWAVVRDWYNVNAVIEFARLAGADVVRVGYDAFAKEPRKALDSVADRLGVVMSDDRWSFLNGEHADLWPFHCVVGNPNRFLVGETAIRPDVRWWTEMSPRQRLLVGLLGLPGRSFYSRC